MIPWEVSKPQNVFNIEYGLQFDFFSKFSKKKIYYDL